ncbi:MAG: zinc-ribbon and DUF3426 domain-containing protein [Aquabacterium sp.]
MSLATRCSACGTVFRVVKDQLLVSEGWVRCGRCNEVFNALEGLFDLERDGLPPVQAPTVPPPKSATVQRVLDELGRHRPKPEPAADPDPAPAWTTAPPDSTTALGWGEADAAAPTPPPSLPADHGPVLDAQAEADVPAAVRAPSSAPLPLSPLPDPADSPSAVVSLSAAAGVAEAATQADRTPAIVADDRPPRFVQAADRAAYWRRPGVRTILALCTLLLAAALAAQVVLHARDLIAARWPATTAWLAAACQPLGCTVQPLARIERLTVDSSGLTRVDGTALYRLSLTLKNRADLALRAPAIELTLTDNAGGVVGRRVLTLADFGLTASRLDPGQELALATTLTTGERRISGYTVELFYP